MKSSFKEGRVALGSWVLRTQSIVVGKARMQEREAAGHMAPTVRNQREMEGWCSAHFLPFRSVWDPSLSDSATHIHSESSPISSAWQETPSQTCPVVCLQIWSTVNTSHHGDQGPAKMEMGAKIPGQLAAHSMCHILTPTVPWASCHLVFPSQTCYVAKEDCELLILLRARIIGGVWFIWCWGLNPGQHVCKASTLRTELHPRPLADILFPSPVGLCLESFSVFWCFSFENNRGFSSLGQ